MFLSLGAAGYFPVLETWELTNAPTLTSYNASKTVINASFFSLLLLLSLLLTESKGSNSGAGSVPPESTTGLILQGRVYTLTARASSRGSRGTESAFEAQKFSVLV